MIDVYTIDMELFAEPSGEREWHGCRKFSSSLTSLDGVHVAAAVVNASMSAAASGALPVAATAVLPAALKPSARRNSATAVWLTMQTTATDIAMRWA